MGWNCADAIVVEDRRTQGEAFWKENRESGPSPERLPVSALAPLLPKVRRTAAPRSLFPLCLGLSLALHAAVFILVPGYPAGGKKGTPPASSVYINLGSTTTNSVNGPETALGTQNSSAPRIPPQQEASSVPADSVPQTPTEAPTPSSTVPMADSPSTVDRSSSVPAGAAPESVLRNSAGSAPGGSDKSAAGGTGSGTETGGAAESAAASLLLARAQAALRYPEAARRRGTEGIVGLRIELDRTGALANLQVVRSSGSALLDRAAGDAVRTSLPVPNPEGRPIAFELSVRFTLKDKKTASP